LVKSLVSCDLRSKKDIYRKWSEDYMTKISIKKYHKYVRMILERPRHKGGCNEEVMEETLHVHCQTKEDQEKSLLPEKFALPTNR